MRILITIMLLWSSVTAFSQEIWQLSPWAPDSSYVIGAMNNGEPKWVKVDSLGVTDSIYLSGDSIRLRDGAGVAQLPTASTSTKGLLSSTDWNTFNGKVGGSGTNPRIAFWNSANSLSSTANLRSESTYLYTGYPEGIHIDGSNSTYASGIKFRNEGYAHCTFGMKGSSFVFSNTSLSHLTLWPTPTDRLKIDMSSGVINVPNLAGSGTRMVTANSSGDLSTSAIPTAPEIFGTGENPRIAFWNGTNSLTSTSSLKSESNYLYTGYSEGIHIDGSNGTYASGIKFRNSGYAHCTFGMKGSSFVFSNTSASHLTLWPTPTDRLKIDMSSGVINVPNLAGSGTRMVTANSSGDLSTSAIPTAPETFAAVGSKIQSWNSTGTFGSGKDVGFGVDPTREIDVNGDARLRGAIYDSANSAGSSGQVLTSQGSGAWTWTTPNTGTVTSVGINTGGGVTSVSGSPVTGSGNISLTLADQSASNELQTISTSGTAGNITLSNGGGTLNLNVNDADANATNELQNLTLTGQTLDISQGAGVTLPIIDVVQGSGITVNKLNGIATISASSAGSTEYIDPYIISSDTVGFILKNVMDTVQFIGVAGVTGESTTVSDSPTINMTLTGTNITGEIVDGSVTPAKLSQAYLTSEVDGSTTNEIQTLSISGSDLTISGAGGNTVTLPSGGGSSEWASLHYGSLAANTQTLSSSVWNTINFTGSSESNASVLDANHTNDEIEFVSAGTYRVDYRVSFIANADGLIYSGIYSSASSSVDGNTQMESDTDSGYKHTIMQHSYIKTAVAGEKIKLQVQPLIAHTSVAIYSNFIVTKL